MRKMMLTIAALVAGGLAFGQGQESMSPIKSPALPPNTVFCPQISQIIKGNKHGNWTATTPQGGWKTYHRSFSNHLTRFYGAQWVGVKLGQLTCIYGSNQQFMMNGELVVQKTFPIRLVYHALAHKPTGKHWKHAKRGVYNCIAPSQQDCPFLMNVKPKAENIYEEAEKLKSESNQQPTPLESD